MELLGQDSIVAIPADVTLYYPNPLASNETFAPYSPQKWYEGGEFFKFMAERADVAGSSPAIQKLWFAWER